MSHQNMKAAQGPFFRSDDAKDRQSKKDTIEASLAISELSEKLFPQLKCAHIDSAVRRLKYWASNPPNEWSELNTRARALRDAIDTEMKEYLYYQYPKDKGQKLQTFKPDWETALISFPETKLDAFSATDCWALQQNTASVFHSMRVAEAGLRALARERNVRLPKNKPLEWGTWQEIIRALDEEIKIIGGKKAGATKDAALAFYSGARADLNGFKDEYRNQVMHVRATYSDFQAHRALTNVHAFMQRLSAKIDHTRQRIRWGRY
jgi:hypothetical protein